MKSEMCDNNNIAVGKWKYSVEFYTIYAFKLDSNNFKMYVISPGVTTRTVKQSDIANKPVVEIKWNLKKIKLT